MEIVKKFLGETDARDGIPELVGFVVEGNLEGVKNLVASGVDVTRRNYTAFRTASRYGQVEIVKYLLSLGVEIPPSNDWGLSTAASEGHLEVVKLLAAYPGNGGFRLHNPMILASDRGHLEVVKHLVSIGADVTKNGSEALIQAASYGQLEVVKYLVSVGSCFTSQNNSAIRLSIYRGHTEVTKYLVSLGVNFSALEPLIIASKNGCLETVKYLVTLIDQNESADRIKITYNSAIRQAVSLSHVEVVKHLISVGAVAEPIDVKYAVGNKRIDIARCLIESGTDYRRSGITKALGLKKLPQSREQLLSMIDMFLVNNE